MFVVDGITEKLGFAILKLLSYHCTPNSTKLIWSQLKVYVTCHNTTYELPDTNTLIEMAINEITVDKWQCD